MSSEARAYTRERLPALERTDGKAETDRLWRNLLSSQPLAFSIAGHLDRHKEEAATLFGTLTGLPVTSLASLDPGDGEWRDHLLEGIEAEWFPPRSIHTGDMSGCDVASCLVLEDGRRVLLTIEVKYTDTFSHQPIIWSRYEEHLTALGLDQDKTAELVASGCSQVLRQIMITNSVVRRGLADNVGPEGRVDSGLSVVLARENDETAKRVVAALDKALGSRAPVQFWSHRNLFQAAAMQKELGRWAAEMGIRYLPDAKSDN